MSALLELADRVEAATGPSKALNREIALAVGWVRQSPSEARRSNPAWFHPDDCRDGKVVMDSLHGTDAWREPLAYSSSVDAAMSITSGLDPAIGVASGLLHEAWGRLANRFALHIAFWPPHEDYAAWLARFVTAAALRARAAS